MTKYLVKIPCRYIHDEDLVPCHTFVYIQVFDGKPEQIPTLWSIILSL